MPPCGILFPRLSSEYYPTTHKRPYAFNRTLSEFRLILSCFTHHWMACSSDELLTKFTTPYPTLALAFNSYTLLSSSPSPTVPFSPITYQYHIRHSSSHTLFIFLQYMVFECRHNIRNQPVSTAIPSARSFHDITTIRKISI